jgi:hypothetical protein
MRMDYRTDNSVLVGLRKEPRAKENESGRFLEGRRNCLSLHYGSSRLLVVLLVSRVDWTISSPISRTSRDGDWQVDCLWRSSGYLVLQDEKSEGGAEAS